MSCSRSQALSSLAESRVDSAKVEIIYTRDDKKPIVQKTNIHETSAMVNEKMRLKRELLLGASNSSDISYPFEGHYLTSFAKGKHQHHQSPPKDVLENPRSLIYSNVHSCQIQKKRKQEQMIRHQPHSVDLNNNYCVPKDNAKMREEKLPKGYCKESLEFPSEHSKIKRRLVECSTRNLITDSCPARNIVYSQRGDNPIDSDSKGGLSPSAVLQRQQQSSSKHVYGKLCNTRLETDSYLFNLDKDEKAKKKYEEAFGVERIVKTKR